MPGRKKTAVIVVAARATGTQTAWPPPSPHGSGVTFEPTGAVSSEEDDIWARDGAAHTLAQRPEYAAVTTAVTVAMAAYLLKAVASYAEEPACSDGGGVGQRQAHCGCLDGEDRSVEGGGTSPSGFFRCPVLTRECGS